MNLLLLGGESLRNRDWLTEVQGELAPLFQAALAHQYAHWQTGEGNISIYDELPVVQQEAAGLGDYGVFAKSAGALVTLKGIAEGKLTPQWCVLTGLPLSFALGSNFPLEEWLAACKMPVRILQNTNDPTASFAQVQQYVQTHAADSIACTELPGDTHEYRDFAAIKAAITSFL